MEPPLLICTLVLTGLLQLLEIIPATTFEYGWQCVKLHNHGKKPLSNECHRYRECKWISYSRYRMKIVECQHKMIFDETVAICVPPHRVNTRSKCYVQPLHKETKVQHPQNHNSQKDQGRSMPKSAPPVVKSQPRSMPVLPESKKSQSGSTFKATKKPSINIGRTISPLSHLPLVRHYKNKTHRSRNRTRAKNKLSAM